MNTWIYGGQYEYSKTNFTKNYTVYNRRNFRDRYFRRNYSTQE